MFYVLLNKAIVALNGIPGIMPCQIFKSNDENKEIKKVFNQSEIPASSEKINGNFTYCAGKILNDNKEEIDINNL